jgi:hypothetical protein
VGVGSFYQPLVALLQDEDVQVRRAALRAAGQLRNTRLWPLVIDKLASAPERRAAAAALVAGGESVLPELAVAWDREGLSTEVKAQMAMVCGRIGGGHATAWLSCHLAHPDASVRTAVLRGLRRCGYRASREGAAVVHDQIRAETALCAETLALELQVGDDAAVALLRASLESIRAGSRARVFLLLSLLYDPCTVLQARDNLSLPSAEKRAYALEVFDVLIAPNVKKLIFPLLADTAPSQKLRQLQAMYPQPQRDRTQCLEETLAARSGRFGAWTQACALYAAGRLPAPALRDAVASALSSADPLVRETAAWALSRLDGADRGSQEENMLTTIEKVIALKQASIFAETPDEALAAIAPHLEEVRLRAGETIIEKGDLGDSMYIIVEGDVRVHDEGHTLNHLRSGQCFGEMAVLDAQPRMASVTAAEDTLLLRLAQEPLYEVMDDRSEVGRGLLSVLSQHLRNVARDLGEARARLEALEGSS